MYSLQTFFLCWDQMINGKMCLDIVHMYNRVKQCLPFLTKCSLLGTFIIHICFSFFVAFCPNSTSKLAKKANVRAPPTNFLGWKFLHTVKKVKTSIFRSLFVYNLFRFFATFSTDSKSASNVAFVYPFWIFAKKNSFDFLLILKSHSEKRIKETKKRFIQIVLRIKFCTRHQQPGRTKLYTNVVP